MTSDPSYCLPADSVYAAAQIMKREDVGPVLVVSGAGDKRLTGIVTDRDLAIKVVGEGRDAHSTRIDEVMSSSPVTCEEDEEVAAAIRKMSENQVRRLPIVDSSGRLVGIISQADVARYAEEEDVGEMVEEISQPYGSGDWGDQRRARSGGASSYIPETSTLLMAGLAVGVGAALMFGFGSPRNVKLPRRSQPEIRPDGSLVSLY